MSGHINGIFMDIRGDIRDKRPGRSNGQLRMCSRSSYHSYGFTRDEQLTRNHSKCSFQGTKRYFDRTSRGLMYFDEFETDFLLNINDWI